LSQHCHKSVFSIAESGLFTAFLQKTYQVFFLDTVNANIILFFIKDHTALAKPMNPDSIIISLFAICASKHKNTEKSLIFLG